MKIDQNFGMPRQTLTNCVGPEEMDRLLSTCTVCISVCQSEYKWDFGTRSEDSEEPVPKQSRQSHCCSLKDHAKAEASSYTTRIFILWQFSYHAIISIDTFALHLSSGDTCFEPSSTSKVFASSEALVRARLGLAIYTNISVAASFCIYATASSL